MSSTLLDGRAAIVTGSARNIGRAIAIDLAAHGAKVVVNARTSQKEAEAVADEIRGAGGTAIVVIADVTNPDAARRLTATAVEQFGRLDILVNNASVRRECDFANLGYDEWREIMAATLDSAYLCCHAALPHLVASGQGAIVNIGGLSAHTGSARRAHVITAKAGLVGLTRALAHDLAPQQITVNCVSPGMIDTVREEGRAHAEPEHHRRNAPLGGRRGTPQEVAALVRFLCGPEARYVTGQTIHANGGIFLG